MVGIRRLPSLAALGLALVALWAGAATAQSVTGTVKDGNGPIVGAAVRMLELNRIEYTRGGGQFSFSSVPKGTYHLFASVIGHASVTRTVEVTTDQATADFELKFSAIPIEEIVVSATPDARPANEQYQSVESKARVDLQNSPGASFSEKISDLPGVHVRALGSAPTRPVLRGLSDNRVLVLENGLRTGDIATYDPAHATPIEGIGVTQIDVVRGPSSVIYGPSTIGGLVNLITDIVPAVSDHPLSGVVNLEGNSVSDQYAGFFNSVVSQGRNAFRFSAGGTHWNDIRIPKGSYVDPASETAFDLERMPQSFDHSYEGGLGYSYQGKAGMIGVGGKHYEMNYGIPGVPPNDDWIDVPPTTSRIAQKRNTVEMRGRLDPSGSFAKQWNLSANYNDYNHSEFPTAQDATGVSDPQANNFHKKEVNGALQLHHRPLGKLDGTIGLWWNIEDLKISGDQPLGPDSRTTGLAGYVFEELQAASATRLQAGLRFDYNHIQTHPNPASTDSVFQTLDAARTSNAVTASLGAIQDLTPGLTGTLTLARSFRAPTVQELFANGLDAPSGTYSIGDPNLDSETGFGADLSIKGSYDKVTFEVSPYVNVISDYIYAFLRGDTIQAFPVRQFAATDARLTGFEASLALEPAPHIGINASTDYVQSQDTKNNVPLPFTPPLRGLVRGTYQDERYMGMIEWRGAATQTRLGDGDTRTGGYGIMNLGFGIRLVSEGLAHNISVHCDNLFDRSYRDHLSVIKDFLPQSGRGFRINYQLLF
ncbi:MAG: TonB-dependent receptor [Candidatus Eisenbacteria bacterium]